MFDGDFAGWLEPAGQPALSLVCPPKIAMLYRIALTIALRAKECASLAAENFLADEDGLSVPVDVEHTKNRKEAIVPVPDTLAALLKPWLAKEKAGQSLWPGLWYRDAAAMLRKDLVSAGVTYETALGIPHRHHGQLHVVKSSVFRR